MDLYCKLGKHLRALFIDLFNPQKGAVVRAQMDRILDLARELGPAIEQEAKMLHHDVKKFLEDPHDPFRKQAMRKHAVKLAEETKEL